MSIVRPEGIVWDCSEEEGAEGGVEGDDAATAYAIATIGSSEPLYGSRRGEDRSWSAVDFMLGGGAEFEVC